MDDFAANNLIQYIREQKQATEVVPSDTTLVVERFHDELGDWRVILHSPFGMPVHAPWALAVGQRLHQRYGLDGSAMAADDGIVLRVPMMEDEPPGAELFLFDPEELEQIVTAEVGGSALFASRFRECAARALLLPRQTPGKRQPLWQQRQRSAQLLDVARKYPTFPIVLETVRECLQDVYDLPALKDIAASVERRELRVVETTTSQPSPFAKSLLFGYVAQFLYEGDSPLAERRAAALALDSTLLNELLGRVELRELLDPKVIESTERELQRLLPDRRARGLEGTADLLRLLGPLTPDEAAARLQGEPDPEQDAASVASAAGHLQALQRANRAIKVNIGGGERFAAVEDAARLRDAIGVPLPMGVPLAFIEPVADPLGDLVSRYARTHGPFTSAEAAARLGLGVAVVGTALKRLAADGRVVEGEFRPHAGGDAAQSPTPNGSGPDEALLPAGPDDDDTDPADVAELDDDGNVAEDADPEAQAARRMPRRAPRLPARPGWRLRSRQPANGVTPRSSASCGAARWQPCAPKSNPWTPPPTGVSCRPGSTSGSRAGAAGSRRSEGWTASSPPWTSSPASPSRPPPGSRSSWPAGCPTTGRPCSTNLWPPVKSCGPVPARSPATTAGSACTWPIPRN